MDIVIITEDGRVTDVYCTPTKEHTGVQIVEVNNEDQETIDEATKGLEQVY